MGRAFLLLLCAAGVASGGFLLLCAGGVLSPARLSQAMSSWLVSVEEPEEASAPVSAPAAPSEEEEPPFEGVFLPVENLDQAKAAAAGHDGVVIPMKEGDGSLGYVSDLPLAADCGASSGDPDRNQALRAMNQTEGLYTVALVSCLRDGALTRQDPELALKRVSGSPWLDGERQGWLDPALPQVQTYLIGVCRELARLGFDEILLTDCSFPAQGDLTSLPENKEKEKQLETLCRRLQGALADEPVVLSVVGRGDSAAPESPSGQTTALLASFGRVWAEEEDQTALAAFSPAAVPSPW